MLDLELINNTITELEADETNFSNCIKLAALLTIKSNYTQPEAEIEPFDQVRKELEDVLPHYLEYCNLKTDYQLGKVGKEPILKALTSVSKEVEEFVQTLYRSTDMPEEREILQSMVCRIQV